MQAQNHQPQNHQAPPASAARPPKAMKNSKATKPAKRNAPTLALAALGMPGMDNADSEQDLERQFSGDTPVIIQRVIRHSSDRPLNLSSIGSGKIHHFCQHQFSLTLQLPW
jgi:hypothetical protein